MGPRKFETFIYLALHPALLTIAILHLPDQTWVPWMLVIPYAFFSYITWPGFNPSTGEGLFWFFGKPFISVMAGYLTLKTNGVLDDGSTVALSYAMFIIYTFSNVIAIVGQLTPALITAPELRYAARRNPVGFIILSSLAFIFVYQLLVWWKMAFQ